MDVCFLTNLLTMQLTLRIPGVSIGNGFLVADIDLRLLPDIGNTDPNIFSFDVIPPPYSRVYRCSDSTAG